MKYIAEEFPFAEDDVWLATFPKSGTTWTQAILKELYNFPKETKITDCFPWIEGDGDKPTGPTASHEGRGPRVFKTHTPYHQLPRATKGGGRRRVIYVARNGKDVAVSLYFHSIGFKAFSYEGPFEHFLRMYLHGEVESGAWHDHVAGFWQARDETMLFLTYEDMKGDPEGLVLRLASFLGVPCTAERAAEIAIKTDFSAMKKDPAANYGWTAERRNADTPQFMRKGQVGDWKNHFSEEQSAEFDLQM
eukprot:CAMPEP_0119137910 /NCGR_PEP_ID=MMETSP1310-20130426/24630_1 /TAXON_ID=464262 /ORGANISM="Genus nov. species nov., Strain RCC2339" /LENGTH=247 /DNA_ID=CAMNT_0007129051 /DNA_START=195 /DNA_END=935 /DNA_ORIENTATION=+